MTNEEFHIGDWFGYPSILYNMSDDNEMVWTLEYTGFDVRLHSTMHRNYTDALGRAKFLTKWSGLPGTALPAEIALLSIRCGDWFGHEVHGNDGYDGYHHGWLIRSEGMNESWHFTCRPDALSFAMAKNNARLEVLKSAPIGCDMPSLQSTPR